MTYSLIFDTETSGIINKNILVPPDKQPEIFEFFGLAFNEETHETVWEYETLIKVDYDLDTPLKYGKGKKTGHQLTGVSNEMLKDAPRFDKVASKIKQIIEEADKVVAHNVLFDYAVVNFEFDRLKLARPKWPKLVDTVQLTEWIKGYRLNLSDLHELMIGERFDGAHRAREDVRALARVYGELLKREWV